MHRITLEPESGFSELKCCPFVPRGVCCFCLLSSMKVLLVSYDYASHEMILTLDRDLRLHLKVFHAFKI